MGKFRGRALFAAGVGVVAAGLGSAGNSWGGGEAGSTEAAVDEPAPDPGAAAPVPLTGPSIAFGDRPVLPSETRACSFRRTICVHAAGRVDPAWTAGVLASAERAWDAASWGLGLPLPDPDLASGAFDVYLVDAVSGGAKADLGDRDPIASFDRGTAFMRVEADLGGCALDTAVARETARAILWRTSPATDAATARAETSYLARLMVPCALEAPSGIDVFQSHPEVSVAGFLGKTTADGPSSPIAEEYAGGASLFYWWLDYSFGASPGGLVRALWALAPTKTPASASRWAGRPTGFDVLRMSFKDALTSGSTLDDLFLDFAVARAFVGATSDADHMPETRSLGAAARPRTEWSIDWPKSPRRLASARGVEPTGSAYIEVDCRAAPKGASLRFEVQWEEHAKMRWAAVKVDEAGREKGAVAIAGADRGTEAQGTVVDLDGVASVLFVGTNTGDPFSPFDPNDAIPEPHGFTVGVVGQTR